MKEIVMPKLSDTMTEGSVVAWRKVVGAFIERGEVIAEVETDKATMELEAFASGVLLEIRVPAGETIPVGSVIGLLGAVDERSEGPAAEPAAEPAEPSEPDEPAPAEVLLKRALPPSPPEERDSGTAEVAAGVQAAPIVRRRAQELGIDLATVSGSGPGGRVLLEDLELVASSTRADGDAEAAVKPMAASESRPSPEMPGDAISTGGEPLSRMRMAIGRTVSESWRTIPHFSVTVKVRMDAAESMRAQLKQEGQAVPLTALLLRASALAITGFPRLNASLQGERLIIHTEINIGIVVRRDEGLLVPVLHDCARHSLVETAQLSQQLVERARNGQLATTELNEGTFAISNLGMYDVDSFIALILPPMAAVLAVGSIHEGMVVEAGRPVVGRLLTLTLSADHRIVDGVYAAQFLQRLKHGLEHPEGLA